MRRSVSFCLSLMLLLLPTAAVAQKGADVGSYVRYQKTAPAKLETSVVTMQGPKGQTLDLVAAVHLGEATYYSDLNARFKSYDAVLYELVLPEEMAGQPLPAQMETGGGLSGIQGMMGRSLGLSTQLDKIDYSAKNFIHADLTQEGLSRSMDARQESLLTYLQKVMMNSGATDSASLGVTDQEVADLDFMSILSGSTSAKDRKVLKKIVASSMTSSDGLLTALGDSALLSERNKVAVSVVDAQVAKGKRKMALFYGAAHMPDMEARLVKKGWKRVKTTWIPAWTI